MDSQVGALFERVQREQSRLDLLVNNVWGGYEGYDGASLDAPFLAAAALAREYGFTDIDGSQPPAFIMSNPRD